MSKSQHLKHILAQVNEKKKKYDWLGAIEFYEKALGRVLKQKDFLKAGDIEERIGFCLHKAAMQAESQEKFKQRMRRAIEAYEDAGRIFEKITDEQKEARVNHCKAMVAYANFWLERNGSLKKKLLDESLSLEKKAVSAYECADIRPSLARAYNDLIAFLHERLQLESNKQAIDKMIQEAEGFCGKAVEVASKVKEERDLARAYYNIGHHYRLSVFHQRLDEVSEKKRKESIGHLEKAIEISKKIGNLHLLALASLELGLIRYARITLDIERGLGHFQRLLRQSLDTEDNYIIAWASWGCAFLTWWSMMLEEDPEKKRTWYKECVKHCENIMSHASRILYDFAVTWGCWWRSYSDLILGELVETRPKKIRSLLKNSVEIGRKSIEHSERCGYSEALTWSKHALSFALVVLSEVEPEVDKKRSFLEEALNYGKQCRKIADIAFPHDYWNLAVFDWILARIKAGLAEVEAEKETKAKILGEASQNMEKSINLALRYQRLYPDQKRFFAIAEWYQFHGTVLNHLYLLTRKRRILRQLVDTFEGAALMFTKVELNSRVAEALWQTAKVHDLLGQHEVSAQKFLSASKEYENAANKIPSLKSFFFDYAHYMQAWSEIEKAKLAHEREEYVGSEEHYNKAANYLQSSTLWNYLALNYSAWSLLEHAEHLSRQEKNQESIQVFQRAAETFNEAKKSLEAAWSKIVDSYEKEKVGELSRACEGRREYCLGRVSVERARVFDRVGDYESSARRYGSAAKAFEKVLDRMEIKSDRRELQSIVYLCQAWQKMKLAEERLDPTLYAEASQLFMKAKESSLKKRTSLLAAGNSCFCKALEFGVKFKNTRNMELYSKTKQYMESASDCYTEAGFEKESFWVNATQVLFDSYVYMGKAETEIDPEKKLRLYLLAERFLDRSANLFEKAGYLRKRNEVLRSIEKVKQKREFMLSLREVLSAPSIASSTSSISAPAPTREEAVGLERFEQAYVQANLTIHPKEVNVGEDLGLEIKLVNTGKEPASLVKVEEILPPGFEPVAKPDYCRFEDAYLDMKGKRLNPLKTEEIRLVLRSFGKGTFAIKPRIIYIDETGHQMFCEPELVTINVSEVILPGRITTGYRYLDNLLFGGIPENYAVILTSPSCDERDLLIKRFLETGAKQGEVTFYVTIDASGVRALAEEFQSNFYVFICNPQADEIIKSLPNVFKLKGVENLTDISIALNSAFRRLDTSISGPRRACIEIISDVLLQHHAVTTRRWLTGLVPDLRSRGFTTLAVMNPLMHPPQEVHAILGLFEGEINIYEKETKKGLEKFLMIKKMHNQKYLESELPLRKEKLERRKKVGRS